MDLGDWALTVLAGIVIGVISGILTFFGLFRNSKNEIYTMIKDAGKNLVDTEKAVQGRFKDIQDDWDRRHDKVEQDIKAGVTVTSLQAVQLGEIRINQININASLNDLKTETRDQSKKLDLILQNGHTSK